MILPTMTLLPYFSLSYNLIQASTKCATLWQKLVDLFGVKLIRFYDRIETVFTQSCMYRTGSSLLFNLMQEFSFF